MRPCLCALGSGCHSSGSVVTAVTIPENNNWKGSVHFGSVSVQSWVLSPLLGPWQGGRALEGGCGRVRLCCSTPSSQETEEVTQREQGQGTWATPNSIDSCSPTTVRVHGPPPTPQTPEVPQPSSSHHHLNPSTDSGRAGSPDTLVSQAHALLTYAGLQINHAAVEIYCSQLAELVSVSKFLT